MDLSTFLVQIQHDKFEYEGPLIVESLSTSNYCMLGIMDHKESHSLWEHEILSTGSIL